MGDMFGLQIREIAAIFGPLGFKGFRALGSSILGVEGFGMEGPGPSRLNKILWC